MRFILTPLIGGFFKRGANLVRSLYNALSNGKQIAISFGKNPNQISHTFRHIKSVGLNKELVKKAVQKSVEQSNTLIQEGKAFNKTINVGGKQITYTAYKL